MDLGAFNIMDLSADLRRRELVGAVQSGWRLAEQLAGGSLAVVSCGFHDVGSARHGIE